MSDQANQSPLKEVLIVIIGGGALGVLVLTLAEILVALTKR